ncbi:MAG TPA: pyridoxamine 5'-phosphate oxidase family protein [Nakamurella sp.]|jgi:hypothetical protein
MSAPSPRTQLRRLPDRARYDPADIHAILDEGFVCHVGIQSGPSPVVIPTAYARVDDFLYLHGAPANAALRAAGSGQPVCVTVTLIDGLVFARSAFHHSINYRSVVIFGTAEDVTDLEEKRDSLVAVVEHIAPGRGADARPPTDSELRATRIIRIRIDEASAKVRTGGPADDPEDLDLPVWAGHLPLLPTAGQPVPAPDLRGDVAVPGYVTDYHR